MCEWFNNYALPLKIEEDKLNEYINILKNEQDKALLICPYYGMRGRTVKGGTLEEIINLQIILKKVLELFKIPDLNEYILNFIILIFLELKINSLF